MNDHWEGNSDISPQVVSKAYLVEGSTLETLETSAMPQVTTLFLNNAHYFETPSTIMIADDDSQSELFPSGV